MVAVVGLVQAISSLLHDRAPFPSHIVEKLLVQLQTRARSGEETEKIEEVRS